MNSTQQLRHQIGGEVFIGLFVSSVGVGIIAAGALAPEGFQSMPFGNTIAIYLGAALLVLGAAYLRTTILLRRMRHVASPDVPSRRELRRSFAALKAQPTQARRAPRPARARHSPQQAHSTSDRSFRAPLGTEQSRSETADVPTRDRVRDLNHELPARSPQIGLRHRRQPTIVELNEGSSHKPR